MLNGCSVVYLAKQGVGQVGLLLRQRPMADVLPELPQESRDKLALIEEAANFAQTLGLKKLPSYKTYVAVEGDAVSWVVQAAKRTELTPYLWSFPVVGKVPYKGFFDRRDALREEAALKRRGFDTLVRGVAAYSLLGFLPDPLYSPMLKHDALHLVSTVIHEMTHATLFLPGEADLNEGLATTVGYMGTVAFFEGKGDLARAEAAGREWAQLIRLSHGVNELDRTLGALYLEPLAPAEKLRRRMVLFRQFGARFGIKQEAFNNAHFLLYRLYYGKVAAFASQYQEAGSVEALLNRLRVSL